MKAVKKLRWNIACAVIVAAGFIMLWQCVNPDKTPLRWRSAIDVPLTNDSFFLAQKMADLFTKINDQKIDILGGGRSAKDTGNYYDTTNPRMLYADTIKGDTAVFSILRDDSISYDVSEDSMKSKDFHPVVGPIAISNAPIIGNTFSVPAGNFNVASSTVLSKIYDLTFDPTSPAVPVTVANGSNATFTNLTIKMLGTSQLVSSLGPNASITLSFPVAGQSITNSTFQDTIQGSVTANASLSLSMDPNGTMASYARVMDSLVAFQKTVTNDYDLTDTLNIDYIDIQNGSFVYVFHNYTSIPLQMQLTQLHLWEATPYCVNNSLVSLASLDAANAAGIKLDSSVYFGNISGYQQIGVGGTVTDSVRSNLSGLRLFPIWNPDLGTNGKSVSRVLYTVKNADPKGATITLSSSDSMLFTIRAPNFKFQEMVGTVVQPYVRTGDTAKVEVPFPWNAASKDSLRGRLILKKVIADIFLTPNLPDSTLLTPRRATIDTLGIHYTIFSPANPSIQVTADSKLLNAYNGHIFRLTPTPIDTIVNQFPDSMYIAVGVTVPVGTHLRAINDLGPSDPDYAKYMGRMKLKANTTVRMNAVIDWQVDSSTSLDLGTGRFKVPKAVRYITKMDGLHATVNINTLNKSNIYLNMFALMAPKGRMNALDSLPLDSVWAYIADSGKAHSAGYINLLGSKGVQIPARDSTAIDTVELNEWQIDSVLKSDSAGWRWEARFLPMSSDALIDTDFVKIKSRMHLEGNNNMDSLLIWK